MDFPGRRQIFGAHIEARRHPLVPELALFLLGEGVDLEAHVHAIVETDDTPMWPFAWAAGAALARHLLDHPEFVRGLDVIDFGAGSGIAGLAAARAGARSVVCVDLDPEALVACAANAALNGLAITTATTRPASWDVALAADVLYERSNAPILTELAACEAVTLVGESNRPGTPRVSASALAVYDVRTFPDVDVPVTRAAIYRFEGRLGFEPG